MNRLTIWTLALLLCNAGSVVAQQYKWVDQNGRTRYGDVPPPGVKATALKPPPGPAAPAAESSAKDAKKGPATAVDKEMEYRKRQQETQAKREKEEKGLADATAKRENCERAQAGLRSLESGQRIAKFDAKGERYFPDDSAVEQEKSGVRKIIQENCN
jgi:hypothetical protein